MSSLPLAIHTAAQVRALDRHAIEDLGIPSYTLMTRAGEAGLDLLRRSWPAARRVLVLCGPGNNAGDGYVLARCARAQGLQVSVVALSDPQALRGDARRAHDAFVAAGGSTRSWDEDCLGEADVVVDAIFGTGLTRAVEGELAAVIFAVNVAANHRGNEEVAGEIGDGPGGGCQGRSLPVLALDIPSGLNADTGEVQGAAIMATCCLSFIGLKLGFYLGAGPDHVGIVHFDALGLPADALAHVPASAQRIDPCGLARVMPRRTRLTHKMQQGSVLVIGGGPGMAGAARMAGEAALRVGAGLVTVATDPGNVAAILAGRPELICHGVREASALLELIERADVLALGPGLGQDAWARALAETALASGRPMVIDADGLNLLARRQEKVAARAQASLAADLGSVPGGGQDEVLGDEDRDGDSGGDPGGPGDQGGGDLGGSGDPDTPGGNGGPGGNGRKGGWTGARGWILTPHPGEAGRLLGCSAAQVQADRLAAARRIAGLYHAIAVLKGAGSLVVDAAHLPAICDRGNPGMASAGMGDVLTGIIAGIAAQLCRRAHEQQLCRRAHETHRRSDADQPAHFMGGAPAAGCSHAPSSSSLSPSHSHSPSEPEAGAGSVPPQWLWEAASAGVLVHAMAGDLAARRGERGLIATDLFAYLPTCVNPVQSH